MLEKISKYHLEKQLGSKKLQSTYRAYSSQDMQHSVVIKVFDEGCLNADYEQEKYQARFKALSMLSNPRIVPVLDSAIDEKQLYIVTEYMAHGSLRSRLNIFTENKHMDWPEALRIVIQVGQALSYVHEHQILHGAMKPENILYDPNGDVRLTDFTLAPIVDLAKLEYKSDLYATRYMAPEQFMGKLDYRSDQYALACLAYELITGKSLFEASSFSAMWGRHATEQPPRPTSIVSNLPMSVEIAILKALEKEPDNRYPDVAAFVKALDVFAARQSSISSLITDPSATFNLPSLNPPSHSPDNPSQPGSASSAALSISKDQREQSSRSSANFRVSDPVLARINGPVTPLPLTDIDSAIFTEISTSKHVSSSQALSDSLPGHILPQSTDPDIKLSGSAWRRKKNTVLFWVSILIVLLLVGSLITTFVLNSSRNAGVIITQVPSTHATSTFFHQSSSPVAPLTATPVTKKVHTSSQPTASTVISTPPATPGVSNTPAPVQSGTPSTVGRASQAPTPPSNPGQGSSTPAAPTATSTPAGASVVRIQAGGSGSGLYSSDEYYNGANPCEGGNSPINTSNVSDPAPQSVYQSSRCGSDFFYVIPGLVPNASYTVRLHFAETYWAQAGKRVFDVTLNNSQVLSNFDIFVAAGASDTAVVETFTTIASSSGQISIDFVTIRDNAQINGIEILLN
ncbi:serine/threonine protein kinase [Ktedonobacteria bacterium brp13]|nr:serine/threonine protein kinase [Ktedonobacteria bacterium brp13]